VFFLRRTAFIALYIYTLHKARLQNFRLDKYFSNYENRHDCFDVFVMLLSVLRT